MSRQLQMASVMCVVLAASSAAVVAAEEEQAGERARPWSVSVYMENDGGVFKRNHITDRYYTNGSKIAFSHQPVLGDRLAETLSGLIPINGDPAPRSSVGYFVGQEMYTPDNLNTAALIPTDRPYAGWLYGGAYLQRASGNVFDHFELQMGVVGPSSLADDAQEWIHEIFDANDPKGWDNQLPDEFGINAVYRRKWRLNLLGEEGGLAAQLIPQVGGVLGNVHRNVGGGATLRAGWALPDDFGPGRLSDLADTTGRGRRAMGIYAFIAANGKYVEHNMFLEGSNYKESHHVDEKPWVGEVTFGIAVNIGPVELLASQTHVSEEFEGQDDSHSYGSFLLTYSTAF